MKKLVFKALLCLGMLIIFASMACEGDQGAKGPAGDSGDDGSDAVLTAPSDRIFSLAIFNGTRRDHNGAHVISLSFDSTASPSSSVVVANKIEHPPVIDGVFDGSEVWGSKSSNVTLTSQAFADNFIKSAKVIASYDDYNIYFLVEWSEVRSGDFVVGENDRHLDWSYNTTRMKFVMNPLYEDRLTLMFQDSKLLIDSWNSFGCQNGCHMGDGDPDGMSSFSANIFEDTWEWGAARCRNTGLGLDRVLASTGFLEDGGVAPINRNFWVHQTVVNEVQVFDSLPLFMHRMQKVSPNYLPESPLWDSYLITYDSTRTWTASSYIPGWYTLTPTAGNDVLESHGTYSSGKWTVEFSRPRITEDPYDVNF